MLNPLAYPHTNGSPLERAPTSMRELWGMAPDLAKRVTEVLQHREGHAPGPSPHRLETAIALIEEHLPSGEKPAPRFRSEPSWSHSPVYDYAADLLAASLLVCDRRLPCSSADLRATISGLIDLAGIDPHSLDAYGTTEWRDQLREAANGRLGASFPAPAASTAVRENQIGAQVLVCPDGNTDENGSPRNTGSRKCDLVALDGTRRRVWIRVGTVEGLRRVAACGAMSWPDLKETDARPRNLVAKLNELGLAPRVEGKGRNRVVKCAGPLEVHEFSAPVDSRNALDRVMGRGGYGLKRRGLDA